MYWLILSGSHLHILVPFDETHLDTVKGLIETRDFYPSASTSRARWSDAATSDKDKQICFMLMPRTWFKMEEFRLEWYPYLLYLFVTWPFSTWPSYILYQYISSFCRSSSRSYHFLSSFSAGWSYAFGGETWQIRKWRWRNLAEVPNNTHNKRLLIRTFHVCHTRRAAGRNQQVEEYKHTHTHTHILVNFYPSLLRLYVFCIFPL